MMNDEVVVFDDVNPYTGMRALLVKRPGKPVEVGNWLEVVPEPMRGKVLFDTFELEQGAFTWHFLRMDWVTRELIGFEVEDGRLAALDGWMPRVKVNDGKAVPAVGWTLDREGGERVSGAIHSAVELYWSALSQYPQVALMRGLPKGAPETMKVEDAEIRLLSRDWVWRGMVVLL